MLKPLPLFAQKKYTPMAKEDKIKYWLTSAQQDWEVAQHLFEKKDYAYSLFFGHLTVEKILKAIFTDQHDKTPPFSHNLVYLSEKAGLELGCLKNRIYGIFISPIFGTIYHAGIYSLQNLIFDLIL